MTDEDDPNNWKPLANERRIYTDWDCVTFVLVDEIDYAWASQWLWTLTPSKNGKKWYATRTTTNRQRQRFKVYLHKEILIRKGEAPPSDAHTIGDHINGNSLDCTRDNLRYATLSMNRRNINGSHAAQTGF